MRLYERTTGPQRPDTARGIWLLGDGDLVTVETFDLGVAAVLVPSELVLVLAVDLPLPTRRRRLEALPFAVEDALAEPIDAVHLALGAEIAPRRHLVGVVAHGVMRQWAAQLEDAGLSHAALIPDALALPRPPSGSWSVDISGGRALIRVEDGTGFAVPADRLPAAWAAGGAPSCISYGDPLPEGMTLADNGITADPLAARLIVPLLDLRQGVYARPRNALAPAWRRLAIVAAGGLLAHAAIAAADTAALRNIAADRETETQALLAEKAPGLVVGDNLVAAASNLLPNDAGGSSRLLPLLARTSTALAPLGAQVAVRDLSWVEAEGALGLDLDAPDLATLQRVQATLDAAGLEAEVGAAAAGDGSAAGKIIVREGR